MKIDTSCVLCSKLDEDGAHLFFKCKHMTKLWTELQLQQTRSTMAAFPLAGDVIREILKLTGETQWQVIVLFYLWWTERCAAREGDTPRTTLQMAQLIRSYSDECSSLSVPRPGPNALRTREAWRPPSAGFVKANCDGAFRVHTHSGGWGFVLRDEYGAVISSGYGKLVGVLEPLHAELIACVQAVQRAAELGIQKIVLVTDAISVVQAVTSTIADRSSACGLIWELKDALASNFMSKFVAYNSRSCNSVAHALASLGASLVSDMNSVRDSIPACIQVLVANNLAPVDQ
jgi:ribonuclease HI